MKRIIVKEAALLAGLGFAGLVLVPLSIYLVGRAFFGEYGGSGFGDFYRDLHGQFRRGEPTVWFLLLSPYILWQLLRVTVWGFRRTGRRDAPTS